MDRIDPAHLDDRNRELQEFVAERNRTWRTNPHHLVPWLFRRCDVRVLLVTDGVLDFGSTDFGLRTFVKILQAAPFYVSYVITLAHRGNRSGDAMFDGEPGIASRITPFRFDNPNHFASDMYDEVWIFGIESAPGIDDTELRAIAEYMDAGGGLFATGDHGRLGKAMGAEIPRVRSMRLWDDTSANQDINEVAMNERRRNDTNRLGHSPGSQFNDQSDDVPQSITPKLYRAGYAVWGVVYPHPLLCGPRGMIKVMPDHPHEGECVEPSDLTQTVTLDGSSFQEYPPGTGGNPQPVPEVISTSTVLAGTISRRPDRDKDPTDPHTFGGVCAYDGHRASVGRVVTDATWHHFVNVNLVGELGAAAPKNVGFLATAAGQTHLEDIKTYYGNLAVWLAPPALISCMNRRILWGAIFDGRVLEAVSTAYEVRLDRVGPKLFWQIGKHARDVLGNATSTCQALEMIFDLLEGFIDIRLRAKIDPWWPGPPPEPDPPIRWIDLQPILDTSLGGAIVALREQFLDVDEDRLDEAEERFDEVARSGIEAALREARTTAAEAAEVFAELVTRPGRDESAGT